MSSDYGVIDTETVTTDAGDYIVRFIIDDSADQPEDEGFALIVNGGRDRINIDTMPASKNYYVPNDPVRVAHSVIMADRENQWEWQNRSGAALVRYLRLRGFKGVTLVDGDYLPVYPSMDRFERADGIAWAPDDVPDDRADTYVKNQLAEWHAWAEGDVFGYEVTGPDGNHIEDGSVWGFYGYDEAHAYALEMAREAIDCDVSQRVEKINLVGAGFVGLI